MKSNLSTIYIEKFKSYKDKEAVSISDLTVLIGANSSGKSTALQALLILKQTLEGNNRDIDLLLSGKYITVGSFEEVTNGKSDYFELGIELASKASQQELSDDDDSQIYWRFEKDETFHGHVKLKEIRILYSENKVLLCRNDKNRFEISVNKEKTNYLVNTNSLKMGSLLLEYDAKYNNLMKDYLSEISISIFGKKHNVTLTNNTAMSIEGRSKFLNFLIQSAEESGRMDSVNEKYSQYSKNIIEIINQTSGTQCLNYETYSGLMVPNDFIELALNAHINKSNENDLVHIIKKYTELFSTYQSTPDEEFEVIELYPVDVIHRVTNLYNQKNVDVSSEIWMSALRTYQTAIQDTLKNIYYLGPLRDKPQGLYNIGFESNPKYVGKSGEFFPSVLLSEKKKSFYKLPHDNEEEICLDEAVNDWCLHMNVASSVKIIENNSFGFSVQIGSVVNNESDIMNVGVGTSQVLPVLITGLLSEKNSLLIFEQPELHLHPYSQSRMADFFISEIKNNKQIIIESHSEYLLLRLRYHVMKNNIDPKQISLNFFTNTYDGTKVKKGSLSGYGIWTIQMISLTKHNYY